MCIAHLGIMYLRAWAWVGQLAAGQAPSPELCSPQDLRGLESQPENLEQPFLSVFKKGRRRVPVRDLGKVVHYAKVQLRFQHSQVGPGRAEWGVLGYQPGACLPAPETSSPALPRTSATAIWNCSTPTSTSRPVVPKDSPSRWGEVGKGEGQGSRERAASWEVGTHVHRGPRALPPCMCSGRGCCR